MKKLIAIIISMLISLNGTQNSEITVDNIEKYVSSDCETVANFIANNLELFVEEYNGEVTEEEMLMASYCELIIPVYVTTFEQKGIYLDFDGNNGYMIIVDNYEIIACKNEGDLSYLKDLKSTYYSIYDGFVYYDKDGNMIPYELSNANIDDFEKTVSEKTYAGQIQGSDGTIRNVKIYMESRYGRQYKQYKINQLDSFEYMDQMDTSIYKEKVAGNHLSEGNCALSSIYALLNYLKINGEYPGFPRSHNIVIYKASTDAFYSKYKSTGLYYIEEKKELPKLYLDIRACAVDKFFYEVGSVAIFNIPIIVEAIGSKYGYDLETSHVISWNYENQVIKEIDNGYPIIWNMLGSSSYGNHTTVVTGYAVYKKTIKVLGIKINSYVKLMALNDNWSNTVRWFDMTAYNSTGSFVSVR